MTFHSDSVYYEKSIHKTIILLRALALNIAKNTFYLNTLLNPLHKQMLFLAM